MSESSSFAATRMNLLRAQKRLQRVVKGIDLLQRKREALAAELFGLVKPAVDARKLITEHTTRAYPPLLRALTVHGQAGVRALAWPARDLEVEIKPSTVWGIAASDIVSRPPLSRTLGARLIVRPDFVRQPVAVGDQFVLCSDGLWSEVTERQIADALGSGEPAWACRELADLALAGECPDNVSVQIVRVLEVLPSGDSAEARAGWLSGVIQRLTRS